eukprot:SAG11_NODE_1543_length_4716_cov_6.357375_2_plen_70_part_00
MRHERKTVVSGEASVARPTSSGNRPGAVHGPTQLSGRPGLPAAGTAYSAAADRDRQQESHPHRAAQREA